MENLEGLIDAKLLLDTINSGVAVYEVLNEGESGDDYRILYFNKMALSHENKTLEEIRGKSLKDLRPKIDEYGLIPVFQEVWKTGTPQLYPAKVYVDDQYANWYENRVFRLSPSRIVAVYDDVTEKKLNKELLEKSEALLREFMNSLQQGIAIYRPVNGGEDFEFVEMNEFAQRITHYQRDAVLGRTILELFPGESSIGIIEHLKKTHSTGVPQSIPLKQYKDGRISQWVENTILPLPSGFVVAIFEDTHEKRMAEQQVRENEAKLMSIFQGAPDGIFIANGEGQYVDVNNAACQTTGYSRNELLQKTVLDLIPEPHKDKAKSHFMNVRNQRKSTGVLPFLTKQGKERKWQVDAVQISDDRFMAFTRDISELERIQSELKIKQERYELAEQIGRVGNWEYDLLTDSFWGSKEALRIYGFPLDANPLTSEMVERCIPERERVHQALVDLIEHDKPYVLEFDIHPQNGASPVTITSTAQLFRSSDGTPLKVRGIIQDVTEQRKASAAIHKSELKYRTLFNSTRDAIILVDLHQVIEDCNSACIDLFGHSRDNVIGQKTSVLLSDVEEMTKMIEAQKEHSKGYRSFSIHLVFLKESGERFTGEVNFSWLKDTEGKVSGILGSIRDISDRLLLEEHLRQALKMEAIGKLAGGIAHDFNNLVTIINGYCDLLLSDKSPGSPEYEDLEQILAAGTRASELTAQLLAFSRKQVLRPSVLDCNQLIEELKKMLERTLGEHIVFQAKLSKSLPKIIADKGQVSQVIINLAVNARDAMENGGRLTIETSTEYLDSRRAATLGIETIGDCVRVRVADTGCGMDQVVLKRAFEPFFTTKEQGKGTGMGLAMVYGIMKQTGGDVVVSSILGSGTVFDLYFPNVSSRNIEGIPNERAALLPSKRSATILVVEDEEPLLSLVRATLERAGYKVLVSNCGTAAIDIARRYQGKIDLLLTDVVMPEISGTITAERIKALMPETQILFMSGYSDSASFSNGDGTESAHFLPKPFLPHELISKINEVLSS